MLQFEYEGVGLVSFDVSRRSGASRHRFRSLLRLRRASTASLGLVLTLNAFRRLLGTDKKYHAYRKAQAEAKKAKKAQ